MNSLGNSPSPFFFKTGYEGTPVYSRQYAPEEAFADLVFETIHPDDRETYFVLCSLGPDFCYSITVDYEQAVRSIQKRALHQHDFFELMYIISGNAFQQIENQRHLYSEGSLCLLNRNIRHQEEFSTDYRCVFLSLPESLIRSMIQESQHPVFKIERETKNFLREQFLHSNLENTYSLQKEFVDFIPQDLNEEQLQETKRTMYSLFEGLTRQFLSPQPGSGYLIRYYIFRIFQELADNEKYRNIPLNVGTGAQAQLFGSITSFFQRNPGRISREELTKEFSYSADYLNRVVRKYSGMSLHQYGMTFVLQEAAGLLAGTPLPVSEICSRLHISNLTQFYRLFRETFGMTPNEYRNSRKQNQ